MKLDDTFIVRLSTQIATSIAEDWLGESFPGDSAAESNFHAAWDTYCRVYGRRAFADFALWPQHPVGQYRIDFAVLLPNGKGLAVEIDGHEFHERTAEQVASRNIRDHALSMAGWDVLHFSGSQVWNDPLGCCRTLDEKIIDRHEHCDGVR